jgi:predicted ArsR family transcriptional regulator
MAFLKVNDPERRTDAGFRQRSCVLESDVVEPLTTRDERIAAMASLDQPLRRQLCEVMVDRGTWITRDDAAAALGVARSVAAFHLDKLEAAGVAEVSFKRTSGRAGPGAGRPSKRYRLLAEEIGASMPDRHYDLAGRLLADAVAESSATGAPVDECLARCAASAGRSFAAAEPGGGPSDESGPGLFDLLARVGYEPRIGAPGEVVLANCPFHRLAERHRGLVCGMNLDFVAGLVSGIGSELVAHLAPEPGACCVRLRQP